MRRFFSLPWLTSMLLLLLVNNRAWAEPAPTGVVGIDPPVVKALEGNKGQLQKDSLVLVEDAKFFNAAYKPLLIKPYSVKNLISFEINEEANIPIPENFDTWIKVRITYMKTDSTTGSVDKELYVGYSDRTPYGNRHTFVLENAARVEVKILDRQANVNPEIWKVLKLVNLLQSFPQYHFDCTNNAVTAIYDSVWAPNTSKDELPVYWAPSIGADEYDLEWTYIDSSALASGGYGPAGSPDAALIFDNNASRVTITGSYYKIPLIYDNKGHLFFRVRPVQWQANGGRTEAHWSSGYTGGLGKFDYNGHERPLNWQATTSFAEEGKRKTVVQYYDGSLRTRQTVTKDNSTENTIVAESFYDYQGRPVIQVLPAPTLNSVLGYSKNFNRGLNAESGYDKSLFDTLSSPDLYCNASAPPMDPSAGAAQYYSPANPLADSGFHKYIPDAKGFPFTEVEYVADNTGRISRQSGVGEMYRIGSGHETQYFYGLPDQRELDALFGTEVGHFSHYFKSMVRDANGQYSVSYTDMRGRTIATAMAGATPDSIKLDTLSSYRTAMLTEQLSDPAATVIKDLVMESKKGLLVSKGGEHVFSYRLDPQTLQKEGCTPAQVCYECLYDLQITITDDCNNQKLGGAPFDTVVHNFQLAAIDTSCSSNSGGFSFSFAKFLPEGSYEVTKKLSVSQYALDYYRDSIFMKTNTCKNLTDFIQEQRQLLAGVLQCRPTCQGCNDSMGTWEQFRERFRVRSGIAESEMPGYENMAMQAYNKAKEDCNALCDTAVSELNDIRRNMLMDMTPSSGQYANLDRDTSVFSVFFSSVDGVLPDTTAKYTQVTNYKDANDNPDLVYDEAAGKLVPPQELDPEVFAQKFKLSWAEALLQFHPEMCKLEKYEMLKNSHEWDKRFFDVDTYAEALAKGYLNPARHPEIPARFNGAQTDMLDPLSTFNNNAYYGPLKDSLLKYRNIGSGVYVSLYGVASMTVMCKAGPDNNTCLENYKNIDNAFHATNMCTAELDMAWRAFRQMYLDIKRQLINQWISSQCTTSLTATTLIAKGYAPHFSDAPELNKANGAELPQNTAQAQSQVAQQMADYYDANCRAYITQWIQQLGSCYPEDSLINVIIPRLVQVCKEGSDADHPYGSSSVKPSSTYTFRSFEEVINNYNQTHGITDYLSCNAYRITAPRPYDKQSASGNKPLYSKPGDCECSSITAYYNKYKSSSGYTSFGDFLRKVYSTNVSDAALDQLLSLCNVPGVPAATCSYVSSALYLPPVFQCYTGDVCISCEQFKAADQAFMLRFPGVYPADGTKDEIQLRNNQLYEDFMNYRLGFSKRIDEYLAFARNCGVPVDNTNELISITKGYKETMARGSSWYYVGNSIGVYDPHKLFDNGVIRLPEPEASNPVQCCSSPVFSSSSPICLPEGYTVEARVKTNGWMLASLGMHSGDGNNPAFKGCSYDCNGSVIFSRGLENGYSGWGPASYTRNIPGTLEDWHELKVKVTTTRYEQYLDDVLMAVFEKEPYEYGKPLGRITGFFASFAANTALVDWVRLSDLNGAVQLFEDFDDPDNIQKVKGAALCPEADCSTKFANFFNVSKGTNYSYYQIDSIYRTAGIVLDICAPGTTTTKITPEQLVKDFNANYQSTYGTRFTFRTQENETYTDLHDLERNGQIQLPDSIRARPGEWYNPLEFTPNGRDFNWLNGYAVEYRIKYLQDLLIGQVFYINLFQEPIGLIISKYGEKTINGVTYGPGIYLSGIQTSANNKFGYDNGGALFQMKLIASDINALENWNNFKVQVKINSVALYVNDVLIIEVPRDPEPLPCGTGCGIGFRGRYGAVDWIKLYDENGQVRYFEDFNDADNPAVTDANYRCGDPIPDCQTAFAQYFNQLYGTSYTYDQVQKLYTTSHTPLVVCGMNIDPGPGPSSPTGFTLCGRSEPVYPPMALDDIDNCSDSTFIIASKAQELYQVYLDSLKGNFDSSYLARCLQAYKVEQFSVRHQVNEFHHTLYYYDQAGNLLKTVPPAGVRANYDSLWLDSVGIARVAGAKKTPRHELVTQYRYNSLNQLVSQESPDGGKSDFWYDRLGRLALSRNARQKTSGGLFSYTRYDVLGRITEVGQINDLAPVSQFNDSLTRNETALNNWLSSLGNYRGQVTSTMYDIPYTGFTGISSRLVMKQQNLRNRVSYVSYADSPGVSPAYNTATFYSYDIHGNVDTLLQDYGQSSVVANIMNTHNNRFKKFVYQYDLISGKVNMVMYQPGWSDQWFHRYQYDAENRLIEAETSLDSFVWEKDARYEYYRHGPLARMVIGHQQVQGLDYAYTLQGWLKGVNSTGASIEHDMGGDGKASHLNQYTARDAFSYTLNYFAGDYKPISSGVNPFPGYSAYLDGVGTYRPLFNGNISSMSVFNRHFETDGDEPLIFYGYKYDQLNRLTGQDAYDGFDIQNNNWNGLHSRGEFAKERIAYDGNGNILKYLRNAFHGYSPDMDSLNYKYYKGNNRLRQVTDIVDDNTYRSQVDNLIADLDNQPDTSNYEYDAIGNLTKDKKEGVTNIKWSVYGKILEVTRSATGQVPVTTIKYTYDASGNRIGKEFDEGGVKKYTWYVRDAQGNLITTYIAEGNATDISSLALNQDERYIYGSSRLGMYKNADNVSSGPGDRWQQYDGDIFVRGRRQYELSNHLGNVLATISDKKFGVLSDTNSSLIAYYKPDIRSAQDYYPFGMMSRVIPERFGNNYRFGFNGQMMNNEVKGGLGNSYTAEFWEYDSRIGRRWNLDPRPMVGVSEYSAFGNNPIVNIDPLGDTLSNPQLVAAARISSHEISDAIKNKRGFFVPGTNSRLLGTAEKYIKENNLNLKDASDFIGQVGAYYDALASVAMWSSKEYTQLDRSVINNKNLTDRQILNLTIGYVHNSDAQLRSFLNISANVAVGEAAGGIGVPIGKGPRGVTESTVTVYRNFGPNELNSIVENGFTFQVGRNGFDKQFWLDKTSLYWWLKSDFSKPFVARITVKPTTLAHGYRFLDAGTGRAISFRPGEALDAFNKNMQIQSIIRVK